MKVSRKILMLAVALWQVAPAARAAGPATPFLRPDLTGMGNSFYRAAVWPSNGQKAVAVGRYWNGFQYRGLIAGYIKTGQQDLAFGGSTGLRGKLSFDFAGAGLESTCMAITVVYNGSMIAACRSLNASQIYETYLVKFDAFGNLDTNFNTTGILPSGLQSGTNSVLVRGLVYNSSVANGHNGVVALVGAIGDYNSGNFHPYIVTFDQQTGAVDHSATTISGLTGTAVGVTTDGTYYYMAATDMTAPYHFYVYRFNSSLSSSGGNWGTALVISGAGGGGDDLPSSINYNATSGLIVGGGDRTSTSAPWACAVTKVDTSTGLLSTAAGHVSLTGYSANNNKGVWLFSHDSGSPLTKSCVVNALDTTVVAGAAYNGTNYDFMVGKVDFTGTVAPTWLTTKTGGSKDDIFYSISWKTNNSSLMFGRQDAASFAMPALSQYADSGATPTETADSWQASAASGTAPNASREATAITDGQNVYYFGGYDGSSTYYNTLAIFDPTNNGWTVTGTSSMSGIYLASAYENGKILLWGGLNAGGVVGTGIVYDIGMASSTAMTTSNAPSARYGHTGLWTGSGFMVWGGYDGSGAVADGGIYDPVGDTWTSIAADINTPLERYFHSAVWNGSRMLVFGGYNTFNATELSDGGQYDPVGQAWYPMGTTNGPAKRQKHFAAWSGTYMLVYGGESGGSYASGIYGYNPDTDSWITGSASGEPHYIHTHPVWTGGQILVWGGNSSGMQVNTGSAFTPATNSWSAISTTNAPSIREYHSAVWTGVSLVVFGGYNGISNGNSIGSYYPYTNY